MTHQKAVATHAAERYLLEEMPELERFQFEEHYFTCAECAEEVRTGGVMRDGVVAGLVGDVEKAEGERQKAEGTGQKAEGGRQKAEGETRKADTWKQALPWAAAAMLAVGLGYQTLVVVPGIREQVVGPQALAPLTLRAATRGAEPTLVRPDSGVVSFALDVNGVPAGARLAYDLRAADGTSVASGSAEAPPPGAPLLLLVPASAFSATGSHTLSVRPVDGVDTGVADYRFTLTER